MPEIDISLKLVVLIGCSLFFVFYYLYLTKNWIVMIGIAACLLAGYAFWRLTQEDWDTKWGIAKKKEARL